jgi:hypothetical protein
MIAYGQQLPSVGARPKVALHDVATQPLSHAAGRRVPAPGGIFLLYDWVEDWAWLLVAGFTIRHQSGAPCRSHTGPAIDWVRLAV